LLRRLKPPRHDRKDRAGETSAPDAGRTIYLEQKARYEPIAEIAGTQLITLDISQPVEDSLSRVMSRIS